MIRAVMITVKVTAIQNCAVVETSSVSTTESCKNAHRQISKKKTQKNRRIKLVHHGVLGFFILFLASDFFQALTIRSRRASTNQTTTSKASTEMIIIRLWPMRCLQFDMSSIELQLPQSRSYSLKSTTMLAFSHTLLSNQRIQSFQVLKKQCAFTGIKVLSRTK